MTALVYICSLLLAALMGFAVHRASLCTVKTVAEILSSRKAYMMATLLKAVIWVAAVSVPILVFLPDTAAPNPSYAITVAAISGGFLFGVGAAVNGGCAFSTLGQLANGNLWMLTTLFGFCIGVAARQFKTAVGPHTNLAAPSYRRNIDGCGSSANPRGNDTLILDSLPGLSPHAIPAFVALLFGISVTLLLMRLLTGKTLKVVCANDIFRTENFNHSALDIPQSGYNYKT